MAELPGDWAGEAVLASRPDRLVVRARRGLEAPVVVKATPPGAGWSARAGLRREARALDAARGDGVVDLVEVVDRRGRTALVLAFVPGRSLADRDPPDAALVARHLRATVARLHHLGLVHGALTADHVLLSAAGQPVLCGFGSAHHHGDPTSDEAALTRLLATFRSGA